MTRQKAPARRCSWHHCSAPAVATVAFQLPNLLAGSRRDYLRELFDDSELLVAVEHADRREHLDSHVVAVPSDVGDRGFVHGVNEGGGVVREKGRSGTCSQRMTAAARSWTSASADATTSASAGVPSSGGIAMTSSTFRGA